MQLSLHADYGLRVLIYLGAHAGRKASTREISLAYSISRHHLVRVVQTLGDKGFITLTPGRAGGLRLARDPATIRLGEVVRAAEPNLRIAECFDPATNTCCIAPVCRLKPVLGEALGSFLETLNRYTLADLLAGHGQEKLASLFSISQKRG